MPEAKRRRTGDRPDPVPPFQEQLNERNKQIREKVEKEKVASEASTMSESVNRDQVESSSPTSLKSVREFYREGLHKIYSDRNLTDKLETLDPALEEAVRQAVVFLDESADTIPSVFQVPFCFHN